MMQSCQYSAFRAWDTAHSDTFRQSVLESVNYDQDRAIDSLLGMSDPEYKPTAAPEPSPHGGSGQMVRL